MLCSLIFSNVPRREPSEKIWFRFPPNFFSGDTVLANSILVGSGALLSIFRLISKRLPSPRRGFPGAFNKINFSSTTATGFKVASSFFSGAVDITGAVVICVGVICAVVIGAGGLGFAAADTGVTGLVDVGACAMGAGGSGSADTGAVGSGTGEALVSRSRDFFELSDSSKVTSSLIATISLFSLSSDFLELSDSSKVTSSLIATISLFSLFRDFRELSDSSKVTSSRLTNVSLFSLSRDFLELSGSSKVTSSRVTNASLVSSFDSFSPSWLSTFSGSSAFVSGGSIAIGFSSASTRSEVSCSNDINPNAPKKSFSRCSLSSGESNSGSSTVEVSFPIVLH